MKLTLKCCFGYLFKILGSIPYPILRHNRCHQCVIGDVKRWVIHVHSLGSHALAVPHFGDFLCGALFDVDVRAGGGVHVDGGGGGTDVEGDACTSQQKLDTKKLKIIHATLNIIQIHRRYNTQNTDSNLIKHYLRWSGQHVLAWAQTVPDTASA